MCDFIKLSLRYYVMFIINMFMGDHVRRYWKSGSGAKRREYLWGTILCTLRWFDRLGGTTRSCCHILTSLTLMSRSISQANPWSIPNVNTNLASIVAIILIIEHTNHWQYNFEFILRTCRKATKIDMNNQDKSCSINVFWN
jgi:hypothetical protein